ncbi:RDD family protein [Roseibacterium sp. SDUM158017]|uniref:RDD family protein n=1 Tax=Roseicyclus salinarum TaxID=3036773 RepID=UPI0024156CE6|nr:RDD family protein [Roseibacterium sp. SDUM158017]MDG4647577.1 RDD family protein [Roseibacterium sp. SDUM158017]
MTLNDGLPDPDYDHAFYDGVPAKRFFAWLVDVAVIAAISLALGLLTLTVLLWVWPILYLTVSFIYRSATIASASSTLGMRLMNLELRNGLGRRLSGGEAMVHTGLYLLLSASLILQLVSIGLIAGSRRHQGLHDHILGTAAINRPR